MFSGVLLLIQTRGNKLETNTAYFLKPDPDGATSPDERAKTLFKLLARLSIPVKIEPCDSGFHLSAERAGDIPVIRTFADEHGFEMRRASAAAGHAS